MAQLESRCLEAFPTWLSSLAEDAVSLAELLASDELPESARAPLAGAVNYLFKSVDLIPDGIEDLGYLDDAFVFRVAATKCDVGEAGGELVARFVSEAALVQEFLGDDYSRFESFVEGLSRVEVRGRSVEQLAVDGELRAALLDDVRTWAESFQTPSFQKEEKTLIKLRSFIGAKLPSAGSGEHRSVAE